MSNFDTDFFKTIGSQRIDDGGEILSSQITKTILETKLQFINLSKVVKKSDNEGNETSETVSIQLFPWDLQNSNPFVNLTFTESMNSPFMYGTLVLKDFLNWGDEFKLNGSEKLQIGCQEPITERASGEQECVIYNFDVVDVIKVTDEASIDIRMSRTETSSVWKIEFAAENILDLNFNKSYLESLEDFVGYIATDPEKEGKTGDPKGLVNEIFNQFSLSPSYIEPTINGIWLKYNHLSWPWMKKRGQMKVLQLLNNLTLYATSQNNPSAVNYKFWQDRFGWHFESIDKYLTKYENPESAPDAGFLITYENFNPNRIFEFEVLKEFSIIDLYNNDALQSHYTRIDPNYNDPYLDFIDTNYGFTQSDVIYDYNTDYDRWSTVNKNKLVSKTFETKTKNEVGFIKPSTKTDDLVYGYMSESVNNTPFPQPWDHIGKTLSGPWSNIAWQPQFDLTDLPFLDFYKIHTKIRKPLKKKRDEYNRKKNIKRKWETYRCTVCCHEDGALGSTADIALLNNPGPKDGITYNILFGPTGIFAEFDQEYKIVAAGSFSDQLNYDQNNKNFKNGLTYSYDLTKSPYNQSIGQFFNLKEDVTAYVTGVIDRAVQQYQILINHLNVRKTLLNNFLANVQSYKQTADNIFFSALIDKESTRKRPIDLLQGYKYVGNERVSAALPQWPITEYEFGMIPSTAIPIGKGVGVVKFKRPGGGSLQNNLDQTIEFRSSSDINPLLNPSVSYTCINPDPGGDCCIPGSPCDPISGCPDGTYLTYLDCRLACDLCDTGGGGGGSTPTKWTCIEANTGGTPICLAVSVGPYDSEEECQLLCANDGPTNPIRWRCGNEITETCIEVTLQSCLNNLEIPCFSTEAACLQSCRNDDDDDDDDDDEPTENDIVELDVPVPCSNDPVLRGYIKHIDEIAATEYSPIYVYAAPYLWAPDDAVPQDWSYFDYGSNPDIIPGIVDNSIRTRTQQCIQSGNCYNTTCLSSNALEALARTCIGELQLIDIEIELLNSLKSLVQTQYKTKWLQNYEEWYDRKAFFYSKVPGKNVFNNENIGGVTLDSKLLSLNNIKKITRKEIRGSRYEILSKSKGITGASAGSWLYEIFFGGVSGSTLHPYYDQKFKQTDPFITSREPYKWYSFEDSDATDDSIYTFAGQNRKFCEDPNAQDCYGPQYRGLEYGEVSVLPIPRDDFGNITNKNNFDNIALAVSQFAQGDLTQSTANNLKNTFNFYGISANSKPPDIKKEEISSYFRIEFNNPIGLDRIKEFPDGFVRDAGVEYFLPYIVQLTPGPFGRQSVKYNCAVIGMDPYGFDVAVKKIKDDIPVNRKLAGFDRGNYYSWWNHDTGSILSKTQYLSSDYNGMDLWPEPIFETDYPYYAYDHSQEDLHGGNKDQDFHNGNAFNFTDPSQDWFESLFDYGMSSGKQFDPLYRTSTMGSYILPNSYRKLKPHRSWWSIFVPRNLFIPVRFANMFKSLRSKSRDLFGGKAIFTLNAQYWKSWYGTEFEDWIAVADKANSPDLASLIDSTDLSIFLPDKDPGTYVSPIKSNSLPEGIKKYFNDSLMNYLTGNNLIYRPQIVSENLWKYDLSGETEYGLITPPVDTEYEFFDRNFALQFMVFARGTRSCEELGLKCANPKTPPLISSQGCTANPYCNCPAQDKMPTESEPTYLELFKLYQDMSECKLIEEVLGPDWLGCEWSDPDSPCSCNCPNQGKYFNKYLAYTRTYATFWETNHKAPLLRTAQVNLINAQSIKISVAANNNVKVGSVVSVFIENIPLLKNKFKNISGRWLVSSIQHKFPTSKNYHLVLTLVRDSLPYDVDDTKGPESIYDENINTTL